uniref:Fibronectin type-III domain-containing protein n=1 Tax=Acrobeloides nanus TaxID=290746 RepID=A0A914DR71_9BILA
MSVDFSHGYYNGYATYIDWSAIPLKLGGQEKDNKTKGKAKIKDRGYKIFIYISETAEKPIVLTLLESELQNPQKPSARIDGLKLMYYYTIKVSGFNEGGIGPLSEPTSIRLGMSEDLNRSTPVLNKNDIVLNTALYVLLLLLLRYCRI